MPLSEALRASREATVREHMESENRHDFDTTIATFDHPRYELIATGDVHDGESEVRAYFEETRTAFPDQTNEPLEFHHSDGAVVVEFLLRGTHRGPLRGLPPTGRSFECRMCALFLFDPDGRRAGLLRPGDDPAPARGGARPGVAGRADLHARVASGEDRASSRGASARAIVAMSGPAACATTSGPRR